MKRDWGVVSKRPGSDRAIESFAVRRLLGGEVPCSDAFDFKKNFVYGGRGGVGVHTRADDKRSRTASVHEGG